MRTLTTLPGWHRSSNAARADKDHIAMLAPAAAQWHGRGMFQDRILFIDGEAIVIDKPAGLPVDRPRDRSQSLEDMLDQLTFGFQRLPLPVHRLDRDTSGCLLLARNPKAHKRFGQAFEAGTVVKRYLAILNGEPTEESGEIDLPLIKVSTEESGWRMTGDPGGKPARTRWEVVERARGKAMLAFFPETGRTHQIRVHAAELTVPREGKPDIHGEAPLPVRFHNLGFGRG
jgi:tRNA pseudouridine32 synthase/23S rRNA pseudouridine746 synthase